MLVAGLQRGAQDLDSERPRKTCVVTRIRGRRHPAKRPDWGQAGDKFFPARACGLVGWRDARRFEHMRNTGHGSDIRTRAFGGGTTWNSGAGTKRRWVLTTTAMRPRSKRTPRPR